MVTNMWFPSSKDSPENTTLSTMANKSAIVRGSVVSFTCASDAVPPPHQYKFYYEQTFLGKNSSGLFQTQVSKSGLYSCVPVNKAGFGDNGTVLITVVGKLPSICSGKRKNKQE